MKFYLLNVTHEAGDKSLWSAFDDTAEMAIERYTLSKADGDVVTIDVRESPVSTGARFGRDKPSEEIIRHDEFLPRA